jgi:MYXO-CTERM domain-containing protein
MFSTNPADKSFASFYFESSYGKYSVTGAVVGPFPFTMTSCDTTGMAAAIEPQIGTKYNHLIYYFNRSNLCTFGGLGEEGSVVAPAMRTWMNGSLSCVVLMQEPGHNLGLMHANTIACGTSSFSTTPATSCTITEYGNTVTPMGSGCHQLNGYEKWYEQWLSGCNGVRVTSTGTFNLVPLGDSCPGAVQVLQVPMPATLTVNDPQATTTNVSLKDYYVELRAAAGTFDQYTAAGRGGGAGAGVTYTAPTVFVYASDDVHPGTAVRGSTVTRNSVWTELINMTPGSASFTGLTAAGQTFRDPAGGATITLQSISASGAIVGVTVPNGTGGPTCIDGTTPSGSGSACDGGAVVIPPFDAGAPATRDAGAEAVADAAAEVGVGAGVGAAADASAGRPDATTATRPDAGSGVREAGGAAPAEGGSSGGGTATAAADASTGGPIPDGSVASDADTSASFGASTQGGGCGCETVGETKDQNRQGAWLAVGALAVAGWGSRRRRERKERSEAREGKEGRGRRVLEAPGCLATEGARDLRDGSTAPKSQ